MNIRKDLQSVEEYIARLLSIGSEFSKNDQTWSHLKNREDFRFISRIPFDQRYKVEAIYSEGRDMAIYMGDELLAINQDIGRFPTLTSILNTFEESWVSGKYNKELPNQAKEICNENEVNLWSVNQMISLFRQQEELLAAVRVTLNMLKDSDLHKRENGIPVVENPSSIHISGNTGSSINVQSDGASAVTNYNEPKIFEEMIAAIKSKELPAQTEETLVDNVKLLAASHRTGGFKEAYQDFMQNVSSHITVFTPFLASLAGML